MVTAHVSVLGDLFSKDHPWEMDTEGCGGSLYVSPENPPSTVSAHILLCLFCGIMAIGPSPHSALGCSLIQPINIQVPGPR